MQYMVLIVHQLAEQRVVGVVNQFSHRQQYRSVPLHVSLTTLFQYVVDPAHSWSPAPWYHVPATAPSSIHNDTVARLHFPSPCFRDTGVSA